MFGKKATISRSRSSSVDEGKKSEEHESTTLTIPYLLPQTELVRYYTKFSIPSQKASTAKNKEVEEPIFYMSDVVFIHPPSNAALLFKVSPKLDATLTPDQYCESIKSIISEESTSIYGLIRLLKNPDQMRPHQLNMILNGKSAYALFETTLYFIDTYAKVKEISSHMEIAEKINPLFPKEYMLLERLSLDKQQDIQKFCDHRLKKSTLTTVFGYLSYRELYPDDDSLTPSLLKKHGIQHYHLSNVDKTHYPSESNLLHAALTAVSCLKKGESIWVQCEEEKYGSVLVIAIIMLIDYEDGVCYTTTEEIRKLYIPLLKTDPKFQIHHTELEHLKSTFMYYYRNSSRMFKTADHYRDYFSLSIPYPKQIKSFQTLLYSLEFKNHIVHTIGFKMLGHYCATYHHDQEQPCKSLQNFAESILQASNDKWYADLVLALKTKTSDHSLLVNFLTINIESSSDLKKREALFTSIKASIDEVLMHLTGYPAPGLQLLQDMYERQLNFEITSVRKLISFQPDASCIRFLNNQKDNFQIYPFLGNTTPIDKVIDSIETNQFWVFELFTDTEPNMNHFKTMFNVKGEKAGKTIIDQLKGLVKKDIMSQLDCDEETFDCIIRYRFERDYYETASESSTPCSSILSSS